MVCNKWPHPQQPEGRSIVSDSGSEMNLLITTYSRWHCSTLHTWRTPTTS